ncbi:hypothetical protein G7Y89_g7160 [Cudoniella acicularis]|uniref:Uncharacterized protein n=1 Tax=Cudoniella acicularis TaxID=354080 RepID=A0A8H4W276_9HELO|nr:hypothetical protein G7Y89_g7160 [Cudoniella acicularis]
MAPHPLESSVVELQQSEITKPQPLRIIKRSKTISGSSLSGEVLCRGRGTSSSSDQSKGSPPLGADRPLTVAKRRKGRGTVLDGRFSDQSGFDVGTTNRNVLKKKSREPSVQPVRGIIADRFTENVLNQEDPDITPKARLPVPRTMSAGVFLKSEFHSGYDENAGRYSVRGTRDSTSSNIGCQEQFLHQTNASYPVIPERRLSKSKNFLLKAISGRSSEKTKLIRRTSSSSRNTLIRRLSRSQRGYPDSWGTNSSEDSSSHDESGSFELESRDITDASFDSRASFYDPVPSSSSTSDTTPLLGLDHALILTPHVTVTPEVNSVDVARCSFWVAIEICGTLRSADRRIEKNRHFLIHSPESMNDQLSGTGAYGYLYSVKIDLLPTQDSYITELVGDLHDAKAMRVGQKRLILAKITLAQSDPSPYVKECSSDELIADLENHLGDVHVPYLTIRISYKHSGFLDDEDFWIQRSSQRSFHVTHLQTDVVAEIRRHDSRSAWSPRNSQSMNDPPECNPLFTLIEKHFISDEAEDILKKLNEDRQTLQTYQRVCRPTGSSEETVKPVIDTIAARIDSALQSSVIDEKTNSTQVRSTHRQEGPFARLPTPPRLRESPENIDPARKIWNEMRQNSRGGRYNPLLGSFSTNDQFEMEEDLTPTRKSSSAATSSTIESALSSGSIERSKSQRSGLDQERTKLLEMALKNKRSLGAETLRSMAPSVARSVGKNKAGTVGGLGLGVGRSWGWGPPWW